MRSKIKYISSSPEKFIPKSHVDDKTLSEDNADIFLRPMVFYIRKLSRDEQFKIQEMIELKDETNPTKGFKGAGDVARSIWENNVIEVRNVIVEESDGVKTYESLVGQGKNDLWNTVGMEHEIGEAIRYARNASAFEDAEAKN